MAACGTEGPCADNFECVVDTCVFKACIDGGLVCNNHGKCVGDKCECYFNYGNNLCQDCASIEFESKAGSCFKICTTEDDCGLLEKCEGG